MLTRYRIIRGARPPDDPLPHGERQDTRKHTRHFLRPDGQAVTRFLGAGDSAAFDQFRSEYCALLEARFKSDRRPFDALASLARKTDVHLGCNCPTAKQPDVRHCHTTLALEFFKQHYPDLEIVLVDSPDG